VSDDAARPGEAVTPFREGSDRRLGEVWRGWRRDPVDRFGIVLVFVLLTIAVSALVEVGDSWASSLAVTATSGAALVAAGRAVGLRPGWRRTALGAVLLVILANFLLAVLEALGGSVPPRVQSVGLVWLALVLVVPVLVIRRILAHRVVVMATIMGAVAAYLQIAVAYGVLFRAIDAWSASPFFGEVEPSTAYIYASLTTISTLGLGDLAPQGQLPRLVLASEAVLGQVFLVTVVSVVVSRFAGARSAS
jgi:hypothetical protein